MQTQDKTAINVGDFVIYRGSLEDLNGQVGVVTGHGKGTRLNVNLMFQGNLANVRPESLIRLRKGMPKG